MRVTRVLQGAFVTLALVSAAFASGNPGSGSDDPIPGELMVELVPGASIDDYAAWYGCTVLDGIPEWNDWLMLAPPGADMNALLNDMRNDPNTLEAEQHERFDMPEGVQRTVGSLDRAATVNTFRTQIAAQTIRTAFAQQVQTGRGVTVAIIDSGVSLTNPVLAAQLLVLPGANLAGGGPLPTPQPDGIDNDGDGLIDEGLEHGTLVAGAINLVAPGARIMPVRVLDEEGHGTDFALVKGILFAISHGADVINYSLGMLSGSNIVRRAVDRAHDAGIVQVGATGNNGYSDITYPARYTSVIAVAAVDDSKVATSWTNYSSKVDLSAPGQQVLSTFGVDGFGRWDGTSFAAPLVSGAVALLLERYPGLTHDDVRQELRATTQPDNNPSSMDGKMGTGELDASALAAVLTTDRSSLKATQASPSTTLHWSPVKDAATYDLARGDVASLHASGANVSLGALACLVSKTGATSISGDAAVPAAGHAFFYVFRDQPASQSSYGTDSAGRTRVATGTDCPL